MYVGAGAGANANASLGEGRTSRVGSGQASFECRFSKKSMPVCCAVLTDGAGTGWAQIDRQMGIFE